MASNKRVIDHFNERVRLRIFGLSSISSSTSNSSGSEHEGEYDLISPSPSPSPSPCLSYLVQNFLEDDNTTNQEPEFDPDKDEFLQSDPTSLINDVINPTIWNNADHFRNKLLAQVTKAVEIFSFFRKNKTMFYKNLSSYLRETGYNASVCKTKWTSSGNLTGGGHEFLDVISPESNSRYIIDTDFSIEFEIVRETENYKRLRSSLPRVFVGNPEDMKKILRLMSDEARRSMKINGLTLPPWRKNRYMQMKWLGPYRRCANHFSSMVSSSTIVSDFTVKCRVGFDVVGDCNKFLVPPVTRTR